MNQKDIDRFFKYVDKKSKYECWPWTGYINKEWGYGNFNLDKKNKKLSHRFSYELHNGPIPKGLLVCHSCDNPCCVNPDHLFLGTNQDNMNDKVKKNRQYRPVGTLHTSSKLTDSNVKMIFKKYKIGESGASIARKFGVKNETIYAILSGRTWKHLGLANK